MSKDTVGSIASVSIGGYAFRADSSADFKDGKPEFKNDIEVTSGAPLRKMEKQSQEVESVTLKVNDDELETLKGHAEDPKDIDLSYTLRSGSTYKCTGWISLEGRQTMTGKADVKMFPRTPWTYFGG